MSLTVEQRNILINLQLEKADEIMKQIPPLQELGFWDTVAGRLYYALFHAVTAMFIYDGHHAATHRGVVRNFGKYYVLENVFTEEEGRFYSQLQSMRELADYNCKFQSTAENVLPMIENTINLIHKIKEYLKSKERE